MRYDIIMHTKIVHLYYFENLYIFSMYILFISSVRNCICILLNITIYVS